MKKGLTLLELIIVIIIVGVLTGLALPRLFSFIESSRATEAISTIAILRSAMERYYLMNNGSYQPTDGNMTVLASGRSVLDIEYSSISSSRWDYMIVSQVREAYFIVVSPRDPATKVRPVGNNGIIVMTLGYTIIDTDKCAGYIAVADGKIRWCSTTPYRGVIKQQY